MTTTTPITRHVLPGLRPEPLASYMAGLGLIRVLCEQADPAATTAAWTPDGLVVRPIGGALRCRIPAGETPVHTRPQLGKFVGSPSRNDHSTPAMNGFHVIPDVLRMACQPFPVRR